MLSMCLDIDYLQLKLSHAQRDDARSPMYKFTLDQVGQDKDSGEIWIQFLQSGEVCHLSRSYLNSH